MSFFLGAESRAKLRDVHPDLVQVVERAILITAQDFSVHCGSRTHAAQRRHVANGTSWTMKSKHLPQADGFAHAVDLVPFNDGELQWEWPGCYLIAAAMSQAATTLDVPLVWGGVWDRPLSSYAATEAGVRAATADYVARRKKLGKRASIDGPHFEFAT